MTTNTPFARLLNTLKTYFDTEELHDLCVDLNLDYENLPGDTKRWKASSLISTLVRAGRASELAQRIRTLRPRVDPNEVPVLLADDLPQDADRPSAPPRTIHREGNRTGGVHIGDAGRDLHVTAEDIVGENKNVAERDFIQGDNIKGDHVEGDKHIHIYGDSSSDDTAVLQEAYLTWLLETCSQVFLRGIDKKAASQDAAACLNLSAIYTALLTHGAVHDDKGATMMRGEKEPAHRGSAVAQLHQEPRLVLLGDPGSGKSTFVNFVVMCLAGEILQHPQANLQLLTAPLPDEDGEDGEQRQVWTHGPMLPVRVILRDFAVRGLPTDSPTATVNHLWEFLAQELTKVRLTSYLPVLEEHLRHYGGLICFDGLDEVPEAEQRRTQIKQVVEDFARAFPKCRILVTSRTYAYQQQAWRLSGFRETVLAAFTRGQIIRFVDRWYAHSAEVRGMNTDQAQGDAAILKQTILRNVRLASLAQRPLLLTLMASLHYWRGGSLPEKREELYNDAVDLLLDWWESSRVVREPDGRMSMVQPSLTEFLQVGKESVQTALHLLAFQAHSTQAELTGTADIAESELVRELMQVSQNQDVRPARLIEYLRDRAGLLVPRGVGVYTFPHRTFQEYLAACYLTDHDDYPENVAELARQDAERWREVLLLAGAKGSRGIAASIWALADALCYRDVPGNASILAGSVGAGKMPALPEDAWGALLAGHALIETANVQKISPRNQPKVTRIQTWLLAILTEQQPADVPFPVVERALAGNILSKLGDCRPGVGVRDGGLPDIVWHEVPAGTFVMGTDPEQDKYVKERYNPEQEQPQHEIFLSTFHMSRYPVTNAQYQVFVEDGGYTEHWKQCWTPAGWKWKEQKKLIQPDTRGGDFDLPNHPVVMISWYEANAFCQWLTLRLQETGVLTDTQIIRLPTEAEWEKAARGEDGRIFPWGNDAIIPEHANYFETQLGVTSTVGCFPCGISPYKCEDMAGNVWEWCQDWYSDEYYSESPTEDPLGPSTGSNRVDRGGAWDDDARLCRSAYRFRDVPGSRYGSIGFRLLRT